MVGHLAQVVAQAPEQVDQPVTLHGALLVDLLLGLVQESLDLVLDVTGDALRLPCGDPPRCLPWSAAAAAVP